MTDLVWVITSSVLILAVFAIRALFGKRMSAGLRYALWAVVLIRLLIPGTVFSSPVSVQSAAEKVEVVRDIETVRGAGGLSYSDAGYIIATLPETARPAGTAYESTPSPLSNEVHPVGRVIEKDATPERFEKMQKTLRAADVLNIVWLTGMGLMLAYLIYVNIRFYLKLHDRRRLLSGDAPCKVYFVEGLESSCLFLGSVYVSAEQAEDPDRLNCVLAHELAHRRHMDGIFTVARCAALVLHWYNPLVWAAAFASRQDSELFADAGAVKTLGEERRESYGMTLIRLSARPSVRASIACTATTMANNKRALKQRVTNVAKKRRMSAILIAAVLVVAAFAAVIAFTGSGRTSPSIDMPVQNTEEPTARPTFPPLTEAPTDAPSAAPTAAPTLPPQDELLGKAYASLSRVAGMYGMELNRNISTVSYYDDEGGLPAACVSFYEMDNRGARVGGNVRYFADGFRVDFNSIRFTPAWNWQEQDEQLAEALEAEFAALRNSITVTPEDIAAAGSHEFNGQEYYDAVGACYAAKLAELYVNAPEGYHDKCLSADAITVEPGLWLSGAYTVSLALRPEDIFSFTSARNGAYLVNDGRRDGKLFGRIVINEVCELVKLADGSWTSVNNPEVLSYIDTAFDVAAPAAALHGVTLVRNSATLPINRLFDGDLEVRFMSDDNAWFMYCDFRCDDAGVLRTSVGQCALLPNWDDPISLPDSETVDRMFAEISVPGNSMTVTREQLRAAGYTLTGGENDLLAAAQYFGDQRAALFTSCPEDNVLRCKACAAVNPRRGEDFGAGREEFIACLAFLPEHPLQFAWLHGDCMYELCEPAGHPEYNGWFGYTLNISILVNEDGSFSCSFAVNAA
ncbi:MAG: hypothetical protein IJM85_03680 [Clostridia bacterium]|nr:hypothetical protein [Clostridia bacterium]